MSEDNSGREHEFASLSDEDVNTLYEIILLTNKQEDGPSFGPGIFSAYDEIITKHGISYEESRKFFAFICRMVAGRRPGQTPMQRFEALLAEAGMNIEVIGPQNANSIENQGLQEHGGRPQEHQRRSDSDEQYNGAVSQAETLAEEDLPARSPHSPGFATKTGITGVPRRRNSLPTQHSMPDNADDHESFTGLDDDEINVSGLISTRQQCAPPRRRTLSVLSSRSLRIDRNDTKGSAFGNGDAYSADESDALSGSKSRGQPGNGAAPQSSIPQVRYQDRYIAPVPPSENRDPLMQSLPSVGDPGRRFSPTFFQRSKDAVERNSDTQENDTTVGRRGILGQWAQRAMERRAQSQELDRIAVTFDRRKLLADSLLEWRVKLESLRLDRAWAENKTFYKTIEDNAAAERERNLKWIAFTHWDQTTKEAKEKVAVAKRHILRRRYFSAWNNVTAVNELKVQRHILRRFFSLWERRMHELDRMEVRANAFHEVRLIQKTYMLWAFAFYDKVSPQWYGQRRIREYFLRWRDSTQQMRQRDEETEQTYLDNVSRKALSTMVAKLRPLQEMDITARGFRNGKLLSMALATWKREAILGPNAAQFSRLKDRRIQRGVLRRWNHQSLLETQASTVCDQRVLRNAFTAWNDQLRIQFLENETNVRLKAEAFYKLILTLRGIVIERGHSRIIAGCALQHWLTKAQGRQRSIAGAEQTFGASHRRRQLQQTFDKLAAIAHLRQQQDMQAQAFRASRLLTSTLAKWHQWHFHVMELELKGSAADFYILTKRSLKAMGQATERHRRERKRQAYHTVRRQNKVNLGREMLMRMQQMLAHVRNMNHAAGEWHEDHDVKRVRSVLGAWKDKAGARIQQEQLAEERYQQKVLRSALNKLASKQNEIASMHRTAREFSAGSAGAEAMTCLRKLDRRLFQLQRQEAGAIALREKFWEKHIRIMLRYWLEQARVKVRERLGNNGPGGHDDNTKRPGHSRDFRRSTATAPGVGDLSVFDTTTWNLEPLDLNLNPLPDEADVGQQQDVVDLIFDPNDGLITSTPLPGYLRTPSKRNTARVKARERLAASTNLNPGTTARTLRFVEPTTVSAQAISRQQTASAPPTLPSALRAQTGVTPFERKLREQGYASSSRLGRATPGTSRFGPGAGAGLSPSGTRFGASAWGSTTPMGWPDGKNTPRQSGFAGFEDILELSEGGTR